MASDDWAERQKILLSAGILVTTQDAKEKIESLDNLSALIEAANASNVKILNSRSIDQLLSLVPPKIEDSQVSIKTSQATLPAPDNPSAIGRVIAPISSNDISIAPRPHGLSHYSLHDFPMLAKDIDSEIEIHFDITGNSITEGKLCLLYTSPSPRDRTRSRMPSSA